MSLLADTASRHCASFSIAARSPYRLGARTALPAGLTQPNTGCRVNGFKVDFYWPDLGLIVETDGLRYHRTPAQQARDRLRDQVHAKAGLVKLPAWRKTAESKASSVASAIAS